MAATETPEQSTPENSTFDEAIPIEMRDDVLKAANILDFSRDQSPEARARRKALVKRARGGR